MSFKSTDKLQGVIPDWKWSIKVHITLCPEMLSFHGRWHCRASSDKELWHTVYDLKPIHVTTDVRNGLHGTQFIQMPINGSRCCVMWVVLPVRVHGLVHSCCLLTISTCLAIHVHHISLLICNIQPTLKVTRDCHQCHLLWHKVI